MIKVKFTKGYGTIKKGQTGEYDSQLAATLIRQKVAVLIDDAKTLSDARKRQIKKEVDEKLISDLEKLYTDKYRAEALAEIESEKQTALEVEAKNRVYAKLRAELDFEEE